MKAKINFLSKEVGQHENVLAFIGAVVDEPESNMWFVFIGTV